MRLGLGMFLSPIVVSSGADPSLLISPSSVTLATAGTQLFSASGGSGGGYVYTILSDDSGGGISTATFTAGDTGGGGTISAKHAVIRVTDSHGNTADATVTITAALPSDVTWTLDVDANSIVQADNSNVTSWANAGSVGGTFTNPGTAPKFRTGIIGSQPVVRTSTVGPASLASTKLLSDIITNSVYYVFIVGINNSIVGFTNGFSAAAFMGDSGGFFAASVVSNTAGKIFNAFNWDGNEDDVSLTGTAGVATLVMQRHTGGNLGLRIGSADTWHTVASGNTQTITGTLRMGANSSNSVGAAIDIGRVVVTKADLTASQINRTINYMQSWGGATL